MKNTKKKVCLALTAVLAIGLLAGCAKKPDSSSVNIGVILPLTGDVAAYGQSAKNGLEMLKEEANNAGGILAKKVNFIYGDDEAKASSATIVAQKLINNDKVVSLVGPLTSTSCIAVGPIAQNAKIPMITGSGTNTKVTSAGDFIFRSCFQDPFQGVVTSKFALEDLKAKTAVILFNNGNDYSKGLADNFKLNFEKNGGKVVATETYNDGDQDFNAQLTKVKPNNADILFLPDYYSTVGLIAKQARAVGIKSTFLGGDGWDSSKLYEIGGEAVKGAYFSNHYSADDTSKEVTDFKKAYEAKYKVAPDAMAVLYYDAGKILFEAIKKAGKTDGSAIRDALKQTDITVVAGKVKFDENRNAIKSAVIVKVEGATNKFVKKINP